ncbi:hypothetical protein GMAR_ORF42 [Golden Marseillevirus]|uniref:hypothetical protein n=1 Tax=Golden Marseillevirus TaxID=1720526 RepID=UPI000877ABF7|nr:hypothetical protein GMAR_ORF42 [Golden Marseillevirus]ALX27417.1 hypothetical protein GMAR_ORF42 [Golden Marseillevirus]
MFRQIKNIFYVNMSLQQEVTVLFRNVVDHLLFARSLTDFFMFLSGEDQRGVLVTEKDVERILPVIYGCHPPASEPTTETLFEFSRQRHMAEYTPGALQKMSDFVQWRMQNKRDEYAVMLTEKADVNDSTFSEKAQLSLFNLQRRMGDISVPSCILAAATLSGSSRDAVFRDELYQLVLNSRKTNFRSWAKQNYQVEIKPGELIYSGVEKVVIKILAAHRTQVLDSRVAFWCIS